MKALKHTQLLLCRNRIQLLLLFRNLIRMLLFQNRIRIQLLWLFQNLIQLICKDLDNCGYKKICMRSDGEPAILSVMQQIKNYWTGEVVPEKSAEGDHQANGSAECGVGLMKGHTRTLKLDLESKIGCKISETP